jgi:DNA-binding ferritin-like protein
MKSLFESAMGLVEEIVGAKSMDEKTQLAVLRVVVSLRVAYMIHQNNHWVSMGPNSYGDHRLFERLYKMSQEDADSMAERLVGLAGTEAISFSKQIKMIDKALEGASNVDPASSSLQIEKQCVDVIDDALKVAAEAKGLTTGLDDLLRGLSSNREQALYLLKQRSPG